MYSHQTQNEETTERSQKTKKIFKCDNCSFKCGNKVTLSKHVNGKHEDWSDKETMSTFIFCLELEDFEEEYKLYLSKYVFNQKEAKYVETMVNTMVLYILEDD